MLTGRFNTLAFFFSGSTSTVSFVPSSFSFSSVFAGSTICSTTVSLSVTSYSKIVSYSGSLVGSDKKISIGINEQYLFKTSSARYKLQNSTLSSFK